MRRSSFLEIDLQRARTSALAAGALGTAACAAGWYWRPAQFFPAYLVAFMLWLGISLGCLSVTTIRFLTGGAWGTAIRRALESAMGNLPLMTLLFVPILVGMQILYPWAIPGRVEGDPLLAKKAHYLNVEGFIARAAIYFLIWNVLSLLLNRWSAATEPETDLRGRRRCQYLSGPALILYGFSVALASVDWAMSLEPYWYSSMYGILYMGGQAVAGLSFAILATMGTAHLRRGQNPVTPARWHDLGNLLLAFVMFWAYVAFMQYLIIWSANLPEENVWYLHRSRGGWQALVVGLMGLHFAVPFLLLLSRDVKRHSQTLAKVAALLLAMRFVDLCWLILPAFYPQGFPTDWLVYGCLAASMTAIGGWWCALFARRLESRAALPVFDPEGLETLDDHGTPQRQVL